MKLVIVTATVLALVYARPETYRENEEFQYSRSSSDDGSKSGYYGAQRGNTGGNYEKAHNMDSLAQHQMSSVVRQVDGELGSGAETKTGSVFTGGNSRGIYGSGKYDLSNLGGRNFAEGTSNGDSFSSLSQNSGYRGESYSANNARYRNQQSLLANQNVGYNGAGETASYVNNQRQDELQHTNSNQEYRNQAANSYKYSQASSHDSSSYDRSIVDSNAASNAGGTIRYTSPVKFYLRPGTKTSIPVTVQAYDANQFDSSHALTEQNQEKYDNSGLSFKPKHYESSYSYKKEWEKHDTQPLAVIPTENPIPKHSELYDISQNLQQSSQKTDSGYHGYNANAKYSNSRKSAFQSNYKAEGQHLAAGSDSQAYTHDNRETKNTGEINNLIGDFDSKPKSYQSSYSYHKSWERRGDPYVIIPADNSQNAQRLTAATDNFGQRSTHQHGSRYNYAQQGYSEDCDENGHIRVARSYDENEYKNFQQESQDSFNIEQQQKQWSNLEDLGQQTQNKWENFDNLGQETQNNWNQLVNLDQNTHDTESEDLSQTNQYAQSNLENFGQQAQNELENLLLTQHQQHVNNLANLEQQTQKKWEDLGQQSQSNWDNFESLRQQQQQNYNNLANLGQQTHNKWDQLEDITQETQNHNEHVEDLGQQTQSLWDNLESLNQQSQNTQLNWPFENTNYHSQQDWRQQDANIHHQHQVMLNNLQNSHHYYQNQQNYNTWRLVTNPFAGTSVQDEKTSNNDGYKNLWDSFDQENSNQFESDQNNGKAHNANESPLNSLWDKIDNIAGNVQGHMDNTQSYSKSNSQDTNMNWNDQNSTNIWDVLQNENTENQNDFHYAPTQDTIKPVTNTDHSYEAEPNAQFENKPVTINNSTDFIKPKDLPNEPNIHPVDVGRGDIDSEDLSTESSRDNNNLDTIFENIPSKLNRNKSPQEIESLSLEKEKSEDAKEEVNSLVNMNEIGVLGLHQSIDNNNIQTSTGANLVKPTSTSTEIYSDKIKPEHSTLHLVPQSGGRANGQSENSHELTDTDENVEQQFINKPLENFDQNLEKFDQNSQNFDQNSEKFDQIPQIFDQNSQNVDLNSKNFDQNSEKFDQIPQIFDQNSLIFDQQSQNFDENSQNFEQNLQDTQQLQQFERIIPLENTEHEQQQNQDLDGFPTNNDFETIQNMNKQKIQNTWGLENNHQQFDHEEVQKQRAPTLESIKNQVDEIVVPVEVTTETPGFWKSLGNKFTSAKESVVSWFKS